MTVQTLPTMRSLTPVYQDSSTPGSIFLNQKSVFRPTGNNVFHYKFDTLDPQNGYNSHTNKRRSTVNVVFNPVKNSVDPYVDASNWLPRLKDHCKGFLARKSAEDLRIRHEAATIIQRAAAFHMDPWMQMFAAIQPTFKVIKLDELKKYLRECVIQIKKMNSERHFIEGQLNDVEEIMEQTYKINESTCLSIEGRKSPNIFAKLTEVKENANKDTFLQDYVDLNIEGVTDVDVCFDPSKFHNSKVHSVYELADKLQQKIHENRHKWQNLNEKCQHLEKEIKDMRHTNTTLDTTTRMLKGIISKNDLELHDQREKIQEFVNLLEKINHEKRNLMNKIKENERLLDAKSEELVEIRVKCEYFESEFERKCRAVDKIIQEKTRQDVKIKDLEEKLNYSQDNQHELESTIALQKTRLSDLKKRLTEQLKATEEELMRTINDTKIQVEEQNEMIESQNERIKQYENTIWRLEHEIEEMNHKDASDEEIEFERERQMNQQLKNSNANVEAMREEMKVAEANYNELLNRVQELQSNLVKADEETTEHKKATERLKAQIQCSISTINDAEMKLNRSNREKTIINQKWTQAKEINAELEKKLMKVQEELNISIQTVNIKNRELDLLNKRFIETRKEGEHKIEVLEKTVVEMQNKENQQAGLAVQKSEEWKRICSKYEQRIVELQQFLEEKEMEVDQFEIDKLDHTKSLKKLQRRIREQEELHEESQKTITKLKDQIKTLQDENETQWKLTQKSSMGPTVSQRISDLQLADKSLSRSYSNIPISQPQKYDGYSTLPSKRSSRP